MALNFRLLAHCETEEELREESMRRPSRMGRASCFALGGGGMECVYFVKIHQAIHLRFRSFL